MNITNYTTNPILINEYKDASTPMQRANSITPQSQKIISVIQLELHNTKQLTTDQIDKAITAKFDMPDEETLQAIYAYFKVAQ